jgi:hypothetical protein
MMMMNRHHACCIVATTNRLEGVDKRLRQGGRFNHEIEVIGSRRDRVDILTNQLARSIQPFLNIQKSALMESLEAIVDSIADQLGI